MVKVQIDWLVSVRYSQQSDLHHSSTCSSIPYWIPIAAFTRSLITFPTLREDDSHANSLYRLSLVSTTRVHHFYANSLPYGILEPPLTSVARYPTILGITWNKLRQNSAVVVHLDRFHIQAISNPCPVHFKHRDGMEVCSRRTQQGSASDAKSVGGKRLPWYFWLYSCFKYSAGSTKSAVVVAI